MQIPTVEIVNKDAPSGMTRINKDDYDPNKHTLVREKKAPRKRKAKETEE